jgi:phosphoribosyl 1,2-cyclic phosphodiesterase
MGISFCSFASGSSGNCYIIKSSKSAILIDVGISTKKIHAAMDELGILRSEIHGVLVTHEHTDHIKAIPVLTKKNPEWKIYASRGTALCLQEKVYDENQLHTFESGDTIVIGDMTIKSMHISHDAADPVCYSVECGGSKLIILTDTGIVPDDVKEELKTSDLIVIEANHEVNMLKMGSYPYELKRRILGDHGHLSNETAGSILAETMSADNRFRYIYLAHLSNENNFPGLAAQTVKNILEESSFYVDRHLKLDVIKREGISCLTKI